MSKCKHISNQLDKEKVVSKMNIKQKLKELEGEIFYTKSKIPFTYHFANENAIQINDRKPYHLSISNFEKALEKSPAKPSDLKELRGSSYVFGIITDNRFD